MYTLFANTMPQEAIRRLFTVAGDFWSPGGGSGYCRGSQAPQSASGDLVRLKKQRLLERVEKALKRLGFGQLGLADLA